MGPYAVYILVQNFESKLTELIFEKFSIIKIDGHNWKTLKGIFSPVPVYRSPNQYYIQRQYDELPKLPNATLDISGFGRIPYDSEDLMLLLRLFKAGDIVFVAQVIKSPEGNIHPQYRYPMVFSDYRSPSHYEMSEEEIPRFNEFFTLAPKWPGWGTSWFKIARSYFLWGGSKEFYAGRDNERILDYMIALEAAFVTEKDFVSRRLRERTATILCLKNDERKTFIKRINKFYAIRSTIAHGDRLSDEQEKFLKEHIPLFEKDVREVLKKALRKLNDDNRKDDLRKLYDISDEQREREIIKYFKAIKNLEFRNELLKKLGKIETK